MPMYDWLFDTSNTPKASWSSVAAAIRDARRVTGRNCESGIFADKLPENTDPGMWLGAIGYMAVIDQLGKIFCCNWAHSDLDKFCDVICRFGPKRVSSGDARILYKLRCALVHDYSLLGTKGDKKTPECKFCLSQASAGEIVKFYKNTSINNQYIPAYIVSLRLFGNLVEDIFLDIKGQIVSSNPPAMDPDIKAMLEQRYKLSVGSLKDNC